MSITKLLLNPEKTGFLVVVSPPHLAAFGRPVLTLGNLTIPPSDFIRYLDCVFDTHTWQWMLGLMQCVPSALFIWRGLAAFVLISPWRLVTQLWCHWCQTTVLLSLQASWLTGFKTSKSSKLGSPPGLFSSKAFGSYICIKGTSLASCSAPHSFQIHGTHYKAPNGISPTYSWDLLSFHMCIPRLHYLHYSLQLVIPHASWMVSVRSLPMRCCHSGMPCRRT